VKESKLKAAISNALFVSGLGIAVARGFGYRGVVKKIIIIAVAAGFVLGAGGAGQRRLATGDLLGVNPGMLSIPYVLLTLGQNFAVDLEVARPEVFATLL
jgi:hypothetical protein